MFLFVCFFDFLHKSNFVQLQTKIVKYKPLVSITTEGTGEMWLPYLWLTTTHYLDLAGRLSVHVRPSFLLRQHVFHATRALACWLELAQRKFRRLLMARRMPTLVPPQFARKYSIAEINIPLTTTALPVELILVDTQYLSLHSIRSRRNWSTWAAWRESLKGEPSSFETSPSWERGPELGLHQ